MVDALLDRKLEHLILNFKESPYTPKVEFLVTAKNATCYELILKVFHNDKLVIDRLLSYSEPLKEACHAFNDITDTFREKDADFF